MCQILLCANINGPVAVPVELKCSSEVDGLVLGPGLVLTDV